MTSLTPPYSPAHTHTDCSHTAPPATLPLFLSLSLPSPSPIGREKTSTAGSTLANFVVMAFCLSFNHGVVSTRTVCGCLSSARTHSRLLSFNLLSLPLLSLCVALLSVCVSLDLSLCISVSLSVSLCLSLSLSLCVSSLYVSLSVCLFRSLCLSLSISLSSLCPSLCVSLARSPLLPRRPHSSPPPSTSSSQLWRWRPISLLS